MTCAYEVKPNWTQPLVDMFSPVEKHLWLHLKDVVQDKVWMNDV